MSSCSFITNDSIPECLNDRDCKSTDRSTEVVTGGAGGTGGSAGAGSNSIPEFAGAPSKLSTAGAAGEENGGQGGSGAGGGEGGNENGGQAGNDGGGEGGSTSCVPSSETCNGADEDCDDIVDEGCALGIQWVTSQDRSALGDSAYGDYFGTECAKDELLLGLRLTFASWLDRVAGICSKPSVTFAANGDASIKYSPLKVLPQQPASDTNFKDLVCPAGEILVGTRISQQHSALGAVEDRIVIPAVWISCAELYVPKPAKPFATTIAWRTPREIGPLQGSIANQTAWFHKDSVPSGTISVRVHGNAQDWIERLGIGTSALSVRVK